MYKRIDANEILPIGTDVKVSNLIGKVIDAKIVQATPCGTVALHTIQFTHKEVQASGYKKTKLIPINKTMAVNYTGIQYK